MSAPATALAAPTTHRQRFRRPGPRAWVRVGAAATAATVRVNGQVVGTHLGAWTPFEIEVSELLRDDNELEIVCEDQLHFTNGFLPVLGVRWTGARDVEIRTAPAAPAPPAAQRSAVRGTQLLVDGRPLRVRGVLHWGFYPELAQPWPDEARIRREIGELQAMGFNLVKFCLWIPPPRYYELCAELGMHVWQEYPVWNSPLTDPAVVDFFREFFLHDRQFPAIILRTMTCENDHVAPEVSRALVELAHELIPGCVALDNSGWLCSERHGDFHDEHPYVHNAVWRYYGRRMQGKLSKPLLLGETIVSDTLDEEKVLQHVVGDLHGQAEAIAADPAAARAQREELGRRLLRRSYDSALRMRRYQIETLGRDLPDAGYTLCTLRDTKACPLGLYTYDGRPKYRPEEWSWHREPLAAPREIPEPLGEWIGPRKGQWKCPEHLWWSPIVRVYDDALPTALIEEECQFELLSGRCLENVGGTRVLVEVWDTHSHPMRKLPMVIEFASEGRRRVVSAFRHDTPAGRALWAALAARRGEAPEIGPLVGTATVLENWRLSLDEGRTWVEVKCDTPLVNRGRNLFEGPALFRTGVEYPGGRQTLRAESVCDYYELYIDNQLIAAAGPRDGTWDGTRDIPRNFDIDMPAGYHEVEFRVRDWRAGGGLVGPIYFATDLSERIF